MALTGVTNAHGPSRPSQQHAGPQHVVLQLQQEVTRPKERFKPTLPEKSGVDGGGEDRLGHCEKLIKWQQSIIHLTIL